MVCIFCGSLQHDYRNCSLSYRGERRTFTQDYVGKSPNVFVGRHGYPKVRVGMLGTDTYEGNDDPLAWSAAGTPIQEIVRLRSALVHGYAQSDVRWAGRDMEMNREVSMAKRPVDVEVHLAKKPVARLTTGTHALPHGPSVPVKDALVTENAQADTRVEKAASATDLTASTAINDLVRKGVDTYYLTKAFSMGNFGIPIERRLVPTRWSITAVDDITGKRLIEEVKRHNHSDPLAFYGGHMGNYYLILFFDDAWQYELFEQHISSKQMWTDYEPYAGRKAYAADTVGGYYAARLAILDEMHRQRRQASVLAIRIITDEYTTPLGVWVVREAVRKAMASTPVRFADRTLMVSYAKELLRRTFGYDLDPLLERSLLMKGILGQRKLTSFADTF